MPTNPCLIFNVRPRTKVLRPNKMEITADMITGALVGVIIGLIPGFLISAWASMITTRLIRFYDLQAEAYEALIMFGSTIVTASDSVAATNKIEYFSRIGWRFLAQGHVCAKDSIGYVQREMLNEINILGNPCIRRNAIDAAKREAWFIELDRLHPSWPAIIWPAVRPKPRPCTCE